MNLANDPPHDEVLLLDASNDLVDAVSWGTSTWAFSPPVPNLSEGSSAERYLADQDTNSAQDWRRQDRPDPGRVDLTAPTRTFTPTPTRSPTSAGNPTSSASPAPTAGEFGLVINEILADPPLQGGDANGDGVYDGWQDEFIELVNHSGAAIDLSGWSLEDDSGTRHVFPAGSLLQSGRAVVIFGGGAPAGSFGGSLVQVASTGMLGLRNFGDVISLCDQDGVLILIYTYGEEGYEDQSLTRSPDITGPEPLVLHSEAPGSGGTLFSPGTGVDGRIFGGD